MASGFGINPHTNDSKIGRFAVATLCLLQEVFYEMHLQITMQVFFMQIVAVLVGTCSEVVLAFTTNGAPSRRHDLSPVLQLSSESSLSVTSSPPPQEGKLICYYNDVVLNSTLPQNASTKLSSFTLKKKLEQRKTSWIRRLFSGKRKRQTKKEELATVNLTFTFEYDNLLVEPSTKIPNDDTATTKTTPTTGVLLIHPIGVGIARWFYHRLFHAFANHSISSTSPLSQQRLLFVAPDLIGSGGATNPTTESSRKLPRVLPLFNISDWTHQLLHVMEEHDNEVDCWCIVANGGCSPIALQIAAARGQNITTPGTINATWSAPVTDVVLSSTPRLPFFLNASDPQQVSRAYRRLAYSGLGDLFWWYACRKQGAFLQRFSERNLVAHPDNLGPAWTPNCYQTATANQGASRYSTFAFLAGTLQDGCVASLEMLRNTNVQIHIIKGRDVRRNRAKSWFWQKRRRSSKIPTTPRQSFRDYIEENGNGGRELSVGGRISLAHEDAPGYRDALLEFLADQ